MCSVSDADVTFTTRYTSTPQPPVAVKFLEAAKIIMEEEEILSMPYTIEKALDLYITLVYKIEQSFM